MLRNTRFVLVMVAILALLAAPAIAQEAKDQGPPSGPGTPAETTGGPDLFGYTFFDNADGCTYDFVDISATGTPVVVGDDSSSGPVTLGSTFNYYGTDYNALVMASNGYISTDPTDTGPDLSNDCPLPVVPSTGGGARMYPLHDDLNLVAGTGQGYYEYFAQCPRENPRCIVSDEPCSVFMWDDVAHFSSPPGTWDQEVVLYHLSGDMVFMVGMGNSETGLSSTTGIQNEAADDGLTYACNTADSVPDNTAVCWSHPDPAALCLNVLEVPTASPTGLVMLTLLILMSGVAMLIVLRKRHAS